MYFVINNIKALEFNIYIMSNTDIDWSPQLNTDKYTGVVKWFNNKSGYGFITVNSKRCFGIDVFAHHSSLVVSNNKYRYLIQGEYVEFELVQTNTGKYDFQSSNITGINGGKLMCETRQDVNPPKQAPDSVNI